MAKILVDTYKVNQLNSGLGQFSYYFAKHIHKLNNKHDLSFLNGGKEKVFNYGFNEFKVSFLNRLSGVSGFDLWHSLYQLPSFVPDKKTKYVLTIHDLNFLKEKDDGKATKYLTKVQRNVNKADAITVISNYVAEEVRNHLDLKGKTLHVIRNGVELKSFPKAIKPSWLTFDKFLFSIGIISAKKNLDKLIPMMKLLPDLKLIISGKDTDPYVDELKNLVNKYELQKSVLFTGVITDEDKYWLLNNCEALVFPSIAEGFGIPTIEAMLCGKPVFLSKEGSLPEIGGALANYWPSFNPEIMANVVKKGLEYFNKNVDLNEEALKTYAKKFSWENCIKEYLKVYESLLSD